MSGLAYPRYMPPSVKLQISMNPVDTLLMPAVIGNAEHAKTVECGVEPFLKNVVMHLEQV